MMAFSPLVCELLEAFGRLPGIGPRGAQRLALHLLQRDREAARQLAACLQRAMDEVGHCRHCRNLSERPLCPLCEAAERDDRQLCVVEQPADLAAIEQSGSYRGRYFVLFGRLSPIDGIGPDELGCGQLLQLVRERLVREVILATSTTVEGEATVSFLCEHLRGVQGEQLSISRIAQGVPLGGELDFVDSGTIGHAISGRRPVAGDPGAPS